MNETYLRLNRSAPALVAVIASAFYWPAGASAQDSRSPDRLQSTEHAVLVAQRSWPVTGFDERTIRLAGIDRLADAAFLTPNMTAIDTQSLGHTFVVLRGISQARRTDPPVAVIVDGAPVTHPAQINHTLLDVSSIEVVSGPADPLRGRGALGGTVFVTTGAPTESFQAEILGGSIHPGGWKARLGASGPIGDGTLKYRGTIAHSSSEGQIANAYLNDTADPYRDTSANFRLDWAPTDGLRTETRLYHSSSGGNAHYFTVANEPNEVVPIRVNNPGLNELEVSRLSFSLDLDTPLGTLSSTTSVDQTEEIATGDGHDYLPVSESFFYGLTGFFDLGQSQYLDVRSSSQELRLSSNGTGRVAWTVGAYYTRAEQFTSSGDLIDLGTGVFPVYREPSTNPASTQLSFVADAQDNDAWSVFGGIDMSFSDRLEVSISARRTQDRREQTTLTPEGFLPSSSEAQPSTGDVREKVWAAWQPTAAVRYAASDRLTVHGSYSRGFRPGGFNQVGVRETAEDAGAGGLYDEFEATKTDAFEAGISARHLEGQLATAVTIFETRAENSQHFFFLEANTSQNVATSDRVRYRGYELALDADVLPGLDIRASYGRTDSRIVAAANPSHVDNPAPLAPRSTANVGVQYRRLLGRPLSAAGAGMYLLLRADYRRIGNTTWAAGSAAARDPIDLVNVRVGVGGDAWSMLVHARNAANLQYNAEYSPFSGGGLAFRGAPRTWGLELRRSF